MNAIYRPLTLNKDIIMFEENIKTIDKKDLTVSQKKTYELASQYYKDSKYYLRFRIK